MPQQDENNQPEPKQGAIPAKKWQRPTPLTQGAIPAQKWERPATPTAPTEPAPSPEVLLDTLLKQLAPPEPTKLGRGALYALVAAPVVLAIVSWVLCGRGHDAWDWVTGFVILVLGVAVVKAVEIGVTDRTWRFSALVVGYMLLCGGAWFGVGGLLPLTVVSVKENDAENEPACPLRVSYDGVVRYEGEQWREFGFQMRGRLHSDLLKVETLAPQGWVARSFGTDGGRITLGKIPSVIVYLDNRNHKETRLACGKLAFAVAANKKELIRIPAAPPGDSYPLALDGKEIGTFGGENVLVDALGTRSYRLRTVTYGGAFEQLMARLPRPNTESPPAVVSFNEKHVHTLPGKVDYFLEPAPEQITTRTFGHSHARLLSDPGKETRNELIEVPSTSRFDR